MLFNHARDRLFAGRANCVLNSLPLAELEMEVNDDDSTGSHDCACEGQACVRGVLRRDLRLDGQARKLTEQHLVH